MMSNFCFASCALLLLTLDVLVKDLKTKMSTKMVGETLEQHCSIEYERYIRTMMPNAYFGKDNDASDGSKGDFIFRDSEDGTEYISIMFEMKNEMDTTATKHKNDDFLKKLDEDRKKKGCEFAVLVSLLEADNDLYNNGMSYTEIGLHICKSIKVKKNEKKILFHRRKTYLDSERVLHDRCQCKGNMPEIWPFLPYGIMQLGEKIHQGCEKSRKSITFAPQAVV